MSNQYIRKKIIIKTKKNNIKLYIKMSIPSVDINLMANLIPKENCETNKNLKKGIRKFISLQNDNIQKDIIKKLNEGTILNLIRNSDRKDSIKTSFSESSKELKYELSMIDKFDENLNTSLSFISEFDLEEEDDKEKDNSFNSLDNDNSVEVEHIEILEKNCKKNLNDEEDDEEHNTKLEKEWEDIQELLLNNKNKS